MLAGERRVLEAGSESREALERALNAKMYGQAHLHAPLSISFFTQTARLDFATRNGGLDKAGFPHFGGCPR